MSKKTSAIEIRSGLATLADRGDDDDSRRTGRPIHKPARVAQSRTALDRSNYRAYRFIRGLNHASTQSGRLSARIAYGPIFTVPTTNRRVRIMTADGRFVAASARPRR